MRDEDRPAGTRPALAVAASVFLGTLAAAAILLPSEVDVYLTPTERADVTYARWQFLVLVGVTGSVLAAAVGAVAGSVLAVVDVFSDGSVDGGRAARAAAAWMLLCVSAALCAVVWLGNGDAMLRSWLELGIGVAGVAGGAVAVVVDVRRQAGGGTARGAN